MSTWRNRRIIELFGIDTPIIQAPMAGASTPELAIAVSEAGGLGSLPCALMSVDQAREAIGLDPLEDESRAQPQLLLPRYACARSGAQHALAQQARTALRRVRNRSGSYAAFSGPPPFRR